jgi:hypothetical protein
VTLWHASSDIALENRLGLALDAQVDAGLFVSTARSATVSSEMENREYLLSS